MSIPPLVRVGSILPLFLVWGCFPPLPKPDPALLGCYQLETDLPLSYGDSLGYEIPPVIGLDYSAYGQWIVYPTDREYHPSWTVWDGLPSSYIRRVSARHAAPVSLHDSINRIPGDSIDINFPSAIGRLVLRLGWDGEGLGGRAEWVIHQHISFMNEGNTVAAWPTSCDDLPKALKRTRYE